MVPTSQTAPIRRLTILGVGLMGGSLALAAGRYAGVTEIRGYDADPRALDEALALGVLTHRCGSVSEAVEDADLVVVCTPVRSIPALVEEALAATRPPRLISDIGSTKARVMTDLSPAARKCFIGGHPICGAETSGVRFARSDLFQRATYFLCSPPEVRAEAHEQLHAFVAAVGARPVAIGAEAHDSIMALVSHVPHVLANLLMTEVGRLEASGRRALYSVGPSFKDLTRVAGANPPMWRDIFFENRPALVDSLRGLAGRIDAFCDLLGDGDEENVLASIGVAATFRQELLQFEDIVPETLFRVTVRIPDEPGVLSRVMTALGDANINIEDLTLHHFNREVGGDLIVYVAGEEAATTARDLVERLGYPTVFSGESGG
ncbi:MAG: prephenate dehydrogenase/arogenate dehydrogenase family protein [Thermoleophilia bacterium]|nr:prephenate dehydrogenase/arogenate dehydrogenase family protein [Thermoleophilia bacterium]